MQLLSCMFVPFFDALPIQKLVTSFRHFGGRWFRHRELQVNYRTIIRHGPLFWINKVNHPMDQRIQENLVDITCRLCRAK